MSSGVFGVHPRSGVLFVFGWWLCEGPEGVNLERREGWTAVIVFVPF